MAYLTDLGTNGQKIVKMLATNFGMAATNDIVNEGSALLTAKYTEAQILNVLFGHATIQGSMPKLGPSYSDNAFVTQLIDNYIGTAVVASADRTAWITKYVADLGTAGKYASRGDFAVALQAIFAPATAPAAGTSESIVATSLGNRVEASAYYAQNNATFVSMTVAKAAVSAVTDAAATLTTATTAAPVVYALTTGTDNKVGSSGNDTITGATGTYTTGDTVDGGAGTDTFNVTLTGTAATGTIKGVEVLNITASPNPATIDLLGVTGLTAINNASSAAGATVTATNVGNVVNTTITTSAAATNITYATAAIAGTSDAATLTLAGVSAGSTFVTSGVETLTVSSTTAANTLTTLTDTGITKLVITGDKALTITNPGGLATLATIDASAATADVTFTNATGSGPTATGIVVTGPATAGITITTGSGKDTITLGSGNNTITTGSGADTITSGAGTNTITPGAGNDTITVTTGTDTIRFAETGATAADTINGLTSKTVMSFNLGAAAVAGTSAASTGPFGTVQSGGTSPVFSNVDGTGTGTAIVFQAVAPNATATSGTVAVGSNVIALNGAYTDGTAAGVISALGSTAQEGIATTSGGKFLLVTYSVGNIAQVWSFAGDATVDTNITQAELSLVATLNNVAQNSLTAANFSSYLTPATAGSTLSASGQTVNLTGTLNTLQSTANAAGQYLTAANDVITVATGTLPTGAATATSGLTILDDSTTDSDVLNVSVLGGWASGSVISNIETINLNMLVAGDTFAASAKTPGTTTFALTGTQPFTVTGMANGTAITLGSGYTGLATASLSSDSGTGDAFTVNLAGSTATSATAGAALFYASAGSVVETATVNVSATSSLRINSVSSTDLFANAGTVTATNLAGTGNLTIFGTSTNLGTMNLNGAGVAYTGALTLRPTSTGSMDFSTNTATAGLVTGIRTIDLQDIATYAGTITLASANNSAAYGTGAVTISNSPTASSAMGAVTVAQIGGGQTDAVTFSLGSLLTGATTITATSIETLVINSSRLAASTLTLTDVVLTDGAGSQTITLTSASAVVAGTFTADTVNFSGVTGTVTGLTLANTAGASFTGGSGNTTVTGTAVADVINTGAGADTITGLAGNDIINPGAGADVVIGGLGLDQINLTESSSSVDTLRYTEVGATNVDTVTGFKAGTDIISVTIGTITSGGADGATVGMISDATGGDIAAAITAGALTALTVATATASTVSTPTTQNLIFLSSTASTSTSFATSINAAVVASADAGWTGNGAASTAEGVLASWYDYTNGQAVLGILYDTSTTTANILNSSDTFIEIVRIGMVTGDYTAANMIASLSTY